MSRGTISIPTRPKPEGSSSNAHDATADRADALRPPFSPRSSAAAAVAASTLSGYGFVEDAASGWLAAVEAR